ncbi:hypothetical protein [Wenzhouxiangella limi]|uniref:hypothetical protein n=1 Tax=Wenzhouxiangella limi TaxID=2707351 RepID=UPI001943BE62|nr:hypothetical protein [Wenzhouxiangella limi]
MGQRSLIEDTNSADVIRLADLGAEPVRRFLERLGLQLERIENRQPIPGSFWGDEEAGLIENRLYARDDTPIHSILHEACHWLCMDDDRRQGLHTNAGGDYDEENAVCYLQILLADRLPGFGRDRCMADMDAWGYSFRLGSARKWFEEDAAEARAWLVGRGILAASGGVRV